MTIQTAAPTLRTLPAIVHAVLAWINGAEAPVPGATDYVDTIAVARSNLRKAAKKNLRGAAWKMLENAIHDHSGV